MEEIGIDYAGAPRASLLRHTEDEIRAQRATVLVAWSRRLGYRGPRRKVEALVFLFAEKAGETNPFASFDLCCVALFAVDSASRLDAIREMPAGRLRAALQLQGLQSTVRQAIERRLRKLARKEGA